MKAEKCWNCKGEGVVGMFMLTCYCCNGWGRIAEADEESMEASRQAAISELESDPLAFLKYLEATHAT